MDRKFIFSFVDTFLFYTEFSLLFIQFFFNEKFNKINLVQIIRGYNFPFVNLGLAILNQFFIVTR